MRDFGIIFGYELKNHLTKKTVIVTTVVIMLFVILLSSLPRLTALFEGRGAEKPSGNEAVSALTDKAGYVFGDEAVKKELTKRLGLTQENLFPSREALIEKLNAQLLKVGFVVQDDETLETLYYDRLKRDKQDAELAGVLRLMHINRLLEGKDITLDEINQIQQHQTRATATVLGKSSEVNALVAFMMMFIIYFIVLLYGSVTSTMIAREKDSKTMELLITSTRPSSLILGKVAASGLSAIIQMSFIFLAALIGFRLNRDLLPPFLLSMLVNTMSPAYIAAYLFYSIVGYIMYLFLYAALGSTVSRVEDVGSATGFVQFLFIMGYLAGSFGMNMPESAVVTAASIFPFTSLMVMPLRAAMVTVPFWQHLLSGGLLVFFTILLALLSIRIYRWGTLNYGNKKGFFHAVRMALQYKN